MIFNKTPFILRPLDCSSDKDMSDISALYASTRYAEMSASGWPKEQIDLFLKSQFESQHTFYMEQYSTASFDLIQVEDKVVGRFYVDRSEKQVIIVDIALFPEYRNQKIGEQLITALQQEILDPEQRLTIHVEHVNPALSFYKRLGFYPVELKGVYILMEWVNSAEIRTERRAQYEPQLNEELYHLAGQSFA
jgi:ribosomal protein S18 acetylase RimI-like enzyme